MFRAVCSKEWQEIRSRILTYPVAALTLSALWQPGNQVFLLVVTGFLAVDMALQTAGDDARWGTFEFIFTRAIDRRRYFAQKFLFGLLPVVGMLALYGLLEAVDLRALFWNLVSEPVRPFASIPRIGPGGFCLAGSALVLLFTALSVLCSASARESSFSGFILLAVIATLIYVFVCGAAIGPAVGIESVSLLPAAADTRFALVMAALLFAPSLALFWAGREFYGRRELPHVAASRGSAPGSRILWLVALLIVGLLLAMLMWAARVEEPKDAPQPPANNESPSEKTGE